MYACSTSTRINELNTLAKLISCECKCRSDGKKCNSDQCRNNNKCRSECINVAYVKKICLESSYVSL